MINFYVYDYLIFNNVEVNQLYFFISCEIREYYKLI